MCEAVSQPCKAAGFWQPWNKEVLLYALGCSYQRNYGRTGLRVSYMWPSENEYGNIIKSSWNNGHSELPYESELIALQRDWTAGMQEAAP
jgi:hypothetical protein